jgi:hypothetical protein
MSLASAPNHGAVPSDTIRIPELSSCCRHVDTGEQPVKREQESPSRPLRVRRSSTKHPTLPALLQVHPVPANPDEILAVTMHLLVQSAAAQGKPTPILSEDAALFLTRRRWALSDLAFRVSRAVAYNEGSLITADDLA